MPGFFTSSTLTDRFAELIAAFQRALARPGNAWAPGLGPLLILVSGRLSRLRLRFAALAGKVRTGTLPAPRPPRQRERPATERKPSPLSPSRSAWLSRMLPECWWVNACRYPLEEFLADPELLALAAAAPQLGRLLRPLCRMINHLPPPWLQLPPRLPRPRPKAAPKPRPPKPVDITRMSSVAWGHLVHPEYPGQQHPPNRLGYARPRRPARSPK